MNNMFSSGLYNEYTFYNRFNQDLLEAKKEVIIESPFLTISRVNSLIPVFKTLLNKKISINIITKDFSEHDSIELKQQAIEVVRAFEIIGIQVFLDNKNHHRKLSIIDRRLVWEGSLNILSQGNSREFMRRIENDEMALETFNFIGYGKILEV